MAATVGVKTGKEVRVAARAVGSGQAMEVRAAELSARRAT